MSISAALNVLVFGATIAAGGRAGHAVPDGIRAGATLKAMFADGVLDPKERAEALKLLPGYYGIWVEGSGPLRIYKKIDGTLYRADAHGLDAIEDTFRRVHHYQLTHVECWPAPTAAIAAKSRSLARIALKRVQSDLLGAKPRFQELGNLDDLHMTINDVTFSYWGGEPHHKAVHPKPGIVFQAGLVDSVLAGGASSPPSHILYGRQRLAMCLRVYCSDPRLKEFIRRAVEKAVVDLDKYEKSLGSAPKLFAWQWH